MLYNELPKATTLNIQYLIIQKSNTTLDNNNNGLGDNKCVVI